MHNVLSRVETIDRQVTDVMAVSAIPLLRLSLAVTYIWFGALKVFGVSPVADVVTGTVPFVPRKILVPLVGAWEMAIGVGLLFRVALRPTLLLFFLQLAGTFMSFLMRPQNNFERSNPLILTKDGEFVLKNLVLLSAGLALGSTVRQRSEELRSEDEEGSGK